MKTTPASFEQDCSHFCQHIDQFLTLILQPLRQAYPQDPKVIDAVIYSAVTTGGKRVRPLICYGTALAFQQNIEHAKYAAAALELMHCYSLIHDDLPSMDDDDFRRNMPSCHKIFGEAHAILAGDIMQVIAFQQLMAAPSYSAEKKNLMSGYLATAARDMVCGQSLDLIGDEQPFPVDAIERMYLLKTGALITASLQLGALSSTDPTSETLNQLTKAGQAIGLAFQIQDDLLDIEEGKEDKMTYPQVVGMDTAKKKKAQLLQQALDEIAFLPSRADFLRELFAFMINRQI